MMTRSKLEQMPRGNTAPGVNREVAAYLLSTGLSGGRLLDVPCGSGEFLTGLKSLFPKLETFGVDISPPETSSHQLTKMDVASDELLDLGVDFDIVTSVSGVMEFDNTLRFFRQIRKAMKEDGMLIVTNDNILSVRDRLLYLFAGRFRQYPLFIAENAPTWKIVPLQNLLRILNDAGFDLAEIRYVPPKAKEWLWLPLAVPIYLTQTLSFALGGKNMTLKEKASRYPFASLLSRHYFVICKPTEPDL